MPTFSELIPFYEFGFGFSFGGTRSPKKKTPEIFWNRFPVVTRIEIRVEINFFGIETKLFRSEEEKAHQFHSFKN